VAASFIHPFRRFINHLEMLAARPTGDKMTDVPFKVGDRVKKRSGYEYPGFIVSVFTNRAGAVRYVVEADHPAFSGMLHIFNGDQLEHR
jgi:hypothetical protein